MEPPVATAVVHDVEIAIADRDSSDDFALTPMPTEARLAWPSILNVVVGIAGAMIFLQVSAQMVLAYGTLNALAACAYATIATALAAATDGRYDNGDV